MITKIISGGQTGADQGALRAAFTAGVITGGYAPRDFQTEQGPNFDLFRIYKLIDCRKGYVTRTRLNVERSDGTLIVGALSAGSILTKNFAEAQSLPYLWVSLDRGFDDAKAIILEWLEEHNIQSLNVAGNRESVSPGIGKYVEDLIAAVIYAQRAKVLG